MRPFVRVNCAMSADGKLAGEERKQIRISSDEDIKRVKELRRSYNAILVGVGTVIADDPHLTIKNADYDENPVRIVLDSNGRTPDSARVLDGKAPTLVVTNEGCTKEWPGVEAIRCGIEDPAALTAHLEAYRERIEGSFIIETLEFLHKGGRCSTVAALGANILRLRPEIVIEDGGMHVGKKFRGPYNKCVYDYIDDRLSRLPELETDLVYVNLTIQKPESLEELLAYVREKTGCKQLIETPASAAISTHCGPNTFGFFFVRKEK